MEIDYRKWTYFDDGKTKEGIEGYYTDMKEYRVIYVLSTNSNRDWLANFFGWKFFMWPGVPPKYWIFNEKWYDEGKWLKENVCNDRKTIIIAYSSGYPRALYTDPMRIHGIAGASQGFGCQDRAGNRSLVWKKGDIVPFLPFSRIRTKHEVVGKWSWPWKAHDWSRDEINVQISEVLSEYGIN